MRSISPTHGARAAPEVNAPSLSSSCGGEGVRTEVAPPGARAYPVTTQPCSAGQPRPGVGVVSLPVAAQMGGAGHTFKTEPQTMTRETTAALQHSSIGSVTYPPSFVDLPFPSRPSSLVLEAPAEPAEPSLEERLDPYWRTLKEQEAPDEMDSLEALLNEEFEKRDRRLGLVKRDEKEGLKDGVKQEVEPVLSQPKLPKTTQATSAFMDPSMLVSRPVAALQGMGKPMHCFRGKGPITSGYAKPLPPDRRAQKSGKPSKGVKRVREMGKESGPSPSPINSPAWSNAGSAASGLDVDQLEEVVHENKYMQLIDDGADMLLPRDEGVADELPTQGMHIVVDLAREQYATATIPSSLRPELTNVGEVCAVHDDGSCDALLVCNCSSGGQKPGPCQGCGHGRSIFRVLPHQRQIACSECLNVDLPFALPQAHTMIDHMSMRRGGGNGVSSWSCLCGEGRGVVSRVTPLQPYTSACHECSRPSPTASACHE